MSAEIVPAQLARSNSKKSFLSGSGEMEERIRAYDWESTPLGDPENWPQSLKTIVRVMLDSRYAMWMLWGPELTFFCNDAYLPTVGIKRDWVLGARSDKVWEEIWPDISPRISQVLEGGRATWDEGLLLFLERSGFPEETYHTFSYSPIYDDANLVAGMLCVVTEVTERVIGERQLRVLRDLAASKVVAESVVDSVADSCRRACAVLARYPFEMTFAAVYLADAGSEQITRAAITSDAIASVLPDSLSMKEEDPSWPIKAVFESGSRQELSDLEKVGIRIVAKPWPDLVQRIVFLPLFLASQEHPDGLLVVGVSPRRHFNLAYRDFLNLVAGQIASSLAAAQAYDAERKRVQALAELDHAKTAFFSNVSHEFRTPLTLMLGPLEDAAKDPATPEHIRTELELAHRNSRRLLRLVNSLLDFSRIEAGRLGASFEPTDLASLTRDLASNFRGAFQRAQMDFVVDCQPLDEPVYVDRELWEKIVLNLLSNAFKFTLEGGVQIRTRRDGLHAMLEVIDTGVGVPEHELPRLFERFHRVENTRARTHEGTGIGLALIFELINLHGGTISVKSEVGRGTTFQVRVPFGNGHLDAKRIHQASPDAVVHTRAKAYVDEALRWLPDTANDEKPAVDFNGDETLTALPRMKVTDGARIVLADDNADMRDYLRGLLEKHYVVIAVPDGLQALEAVRTQAPDLVLTDVMMPRLDGFGLLKALRSDINTTSIPVILLSARAGEEATIEGFDAGADDYLVKPFSARELLARISGTLALSKARREAEIERKISEEKFRAVHEASPDGFTVLEAVRDHRGRIEDFKWVYLNEAAAAMAKGKREALIGQRILELHPGNKSTGLFDTYVRVAESGEQWVEEMHYQKDGIDALVRLAVARVGDGVAISTVDMSERHRAETALKQADQRKDEFLATLAHELRNPLAPIRQAARIASTQGVTEAQRRWSNDIINRQTQHMAMLLDDLLDLSRITRGTLEVRKAPVDLIPIIETAIETARPLIDSRKHVLDVDIADKNVTVVVDSLRIAQALANLLTNAAKYTDPGGQIKLRVFRENDGLHMEVSDNGIGIPQENISTVFEMFSQVKSAIDRSEGGLGIGLALVKGVVQLHGGHVSVVSEGSRRGSTFTIVLPLDSSRETPPVSGTSAEEATSALSCKILVVDDNRDAAETLAMLVQLDGHEVRVAFDATQAMEIAAGFQPDIALLDIGLPNVNGYELAKRIKSTHWGKSVILIAVTGWGQENDRSNAMHAGFDHHLTKPVDSAELLKLLGKVAAKAAARQEKA